MYITCIHLSKECTQFYTFIVHNFSKTIRNYIFSMYTDFQKMYRNVHIFVKKMYIILYTQHTCNKGQTMVVQQPPKKKSD